MGRMIWYERVGYEWCMTTITCNFLVFVVMTLMEVWEESFESLVMKEHLVLWLQMEGFFTTKLLWAYGTSPSFTFTLMALHIKKV